MVPYIFAICLDLMDETLFDLAELKFLSQKLAYKPVQSTLPHVSAVVAKLKDPEVPSLDVRF